MMSDEERPDRVRPGERQGRVIYIPDTTSGRRVMRLDVEDCGGRVPPGRGRAGIVRDQREPKAPIARVRAPVPANRSLTNAVGRLAEVFIRSWLEATPGSEVEVRWSARQVIFHLDGYIVGYEFDEMRRAAGSPGATPQAFRRTVDDTLMLARRAHEGPTPAPDDALGPEDL